MGLITKKLVINGDNQATYMEQVNGVSGTSTLYGSTVVGLWGKSGTYDVHLNGTALNELYPDDEAVPLAWRITMNVAATQLSGWLGYKKWVAVINDSTLLTEQYSPTSASLYDVEFVDGNFVALANVSKTLNSTPILKTKRQINPGVRIYGSSAMTTAAIGVGTLTVEALFEVHTGLYAKKGSDWEEAVNLWKKVDGQWVSTSLSEVKNVMNGVFTTVDGNITRGSQSGDLVQLPSGLWVSKFLI